MACSLFSGIGRAALILVAAVRSKLGASHHWLQTLEQQRWQPVVSPALAFEYEAVLKRGLPKTGLVCNLATKERPTGDEEKYAEMLMTLIKAYEEKHHS